MVCCDKTESTEITGSDNNRVEYMMNFHILTLFPEMIMQGLGTSIIGRAAENGLITLNAVNIRDYSLDKHKKVDDYPYGGGAGMLMQAQPVFDAYKSVVQRTAKTEKNSKPSKVRTIYMTPQGIPFTQRKAQELAGEKDLIFLCGHYEGVDERVLQEIVTDYISIGDYVLTGGELPAMVMIDAISRLVPGVLNNDFSAQTETFHNDLLEYPQYTRPEIWHDRKVPEILLSGNHRRIDDWRLEQSEERTERIRPELYERYQEKQKVIRQLIRHKRDYIHMIELLKRGNGEILYAQDNALLLLDLKSGACMMTVSCLEAGEMLLDLIPEETKLFVVSQEFMVDSICRQFHAELHSCCYQASYTRRETLAVRHKDIRLLDETHLDYILDHYSLGSREYIQERIRAKVFYGAFVDGKLAGFIGIHDEGSMGMLFVEEPYRRMGLAHSLESHMINRMKELGYTPFCQIFSNNDASMALQLSLGMNISSGKVWWLEKE